MITPNYQHVKGNHFNTVISDDQHVTIQVVAGNLDGKTGKIATQTSVNAFMIDMEAGGEHPIAIPDTHQSLVYLLHGDVIVNDKEQLTEGANQLLTFHQDGEGISIKANTKSKLLFLSGVPLKEKVASWGPYVMNSQTEIMEALRDYQMGKMGFLPR